MQGKENLDETRGSRNRKYLFHQDFQFYTAGVALKRRERRRGRSGLFGTYERGNDRRGKAKHSFGRMLRGPVTYRWS